MLPRLIPFLVAFFSIAACSKKSVENGGPPGQGNPIPVQIGKVVQKDMPVDLRTFGNVEPISSVAVKAQVGGELIEVNFREGQTVTRGQLLFTIQPKLYVTRLAEAEANLARDRVTAANTLRDAERSSDLGKTGAVSREQLDQARALADAAASTVKADEALVEIATVQVGYTTIESPIDGVAGAVRVKAGNLIKLNADDAMVTINQIQPIYVAFAVPEQHLAEIRKGMAERDLPVVAYDPRTNASLAEGALTFISNEVDMTTGTITLKGTFANEDRALWPGAFVDVVLHLATQKNAVVAPSAAIFVGQKGAQVFVAGDDGAAELRQVKVARSLGPESVIQAGLAAGERVVINGQSRLVPGAKIVVNPDPATEANTAASSVGDNVSP